MVVKGGEAYVFSLQTFGGLSTQKIFKILVCNSLKLANVTDKRWLMGIYEWFD